MRRGPSGRRPGGQPGHEGQTRALVPVEAVDVVIPLKPVRCALVSTYGWERIEPERHQVTGDPTRATGDH